jgi:hypothetical protein
VHWLGQPQTVILLPLPPEYLNHRFVLPFLVINMNLRIVVQPNYHQIIDFNIFKALLMYLMLDLKVNKCDWLSSYLNGYRATSFDCFHQLFIEGRILELHSASIWIFPVTWYLFFIALLCFSACCLIIA